MRLKLPIVLVLLFKVGVAIPAVAQGPWSLFVGAGAAGFGGGSDAVDPAPGDPTQFKPTPTTRFHAGITREFNRGGITLDASYARAGFGGYGGNVDFSITPGLTLDDLRLMGSYAFARLGQGSLRLGLGPMLQVWSGDAVSSTQTRIGAAASLTAVVPISTSFGFLLSGSLGVAATPFDQETLDASDVTGLTTWTRELAVGLRLTL